MFEIFTLPMPQLGREREITVYLPEDYATQTHHYPVIYIHDAQNLFDDALAFGGQAWRIQNHLNTTTTPQAIVVAIANSEFRFGEYSPFPISPYGTSLTQGQFVPPAEGIAYVDWIVHTLKPHLDAQYRTLPTAEHTTIVGSSMGGLISLYAGIAYPDCFANLGVLSPAFWFCKDAIMHFLQTHPLPETSRVYLSVGTHEGGGIAHDEDYLLDALACKELVANQACALEFTIIPDGQHHESAWEPLTQHWCQFFKIK